MKIADLSKPFPPAKVHWRIGQVTKANKHKASALCYIDARDVMERLDEVCGPEGWQDEYTVHGPRVICTIRVKVGEEWIGKSDGAGDTAVEGEKGGISDAFKRAAVKWGVGRYLYDIPMQWVQIDDFKRILPSEAGKLQKALPGSSVETAKEQPATAPSAKSAKPLPAPEKPCSIPVTVDANDESDWKAWAENLRLAIRTAPTLADLNAWMKINEFALGNLRKASAPAADFLQQQADIQRGILVQDNPEKDAA